MQTKWQLFIFLLIVAVATEKKCPVHETISPCRCLIKREEIQVWCSHSDLPNVLEGLKSISKNIIDPIDELILENNLLPSLPGRTFAHLKILRLMLRYNGLERVSTDWLVGLEKSLMELFLVEPNLRSLPDDSLIHLNNVEAITIHSNLMKRYPIFTGLTKLKYLQLESLSLLELAPRHFHDIPLLESIHMTNSPRLSRLEESFLQDLPRLAVVNISHCGISWLHPRAITRLPNLKELSLVGNKIFDVGMVGRAARDLPRLEILRLDHNSIDKLAEAAFVDLPSLKQLFLSNNHISELHYGAFHRVPHLRSLNLNKNMVRRIHPESFLQHSGSRVEELWLVDNDISHVIELRSLLDALPRLIFLDISFNNLKEIPFGALRGHPTLERLHLDFNKIHLIDTEALMAMPALRELRLKNNSLSEVLNGPLWNLPALKGLDLSGNFYRRLEPKLLSNLPSLRRIDLSNNELSFIDPTSFLSTPALEHINLSYNALDNLHPATFRPLHKLYELDVSFNYVMDFVPNLPRGLEYLHMSHNKIETIPAPPSPDLDLPSLRMLNIAYNEIHFIPSNSMRSLPHLRRIYLGQNALTKLEETSLSGLSRLEIVDLEGNKLVHIHRNCFIDNIELKELNLRNNRLDIVFPEVFTNTPLLHRLDLSYNKLSELIPGLLDKAKDLKILDLSNNFLVQLPHNLFALKNLKILDLTNNRLKDLTSQTLNTLTSLRELQIAENFIQELKTGVFENLHYLRVLNLDSNELEVMEENAIHNLQALKSLKVSRNKLQEIPNFAFNNLPSLQIVELQENQIKNIANQAFHQVPHLVMLNLSHNHLDGLEEAGLHSLKSLEMLDVSGNRISRVTTSNLNKMDWLVELRMSDNNICAIHGSPFNGMSRLRVLNLRNNKMMSLPEQAVQKLRTNLAVLDLEGNPLACSCNLLWLQAWLMEGSSKGPRCVDGTYLREVPLSRQNCRSEERNVELVAPGCESELLTAPAEFGTSQVFSPWMRLKTNQTKSKNYIAPSPEESEYFYDEYIDYPYNKTLEIIKGEFNSSSSTTTTTQSSHYIAGDTPTIYASPKNKTKDFPKEVSDSPSSSGFTFFGVPLPTLNLKNFWPAKVSNGSGRMNDHRVPLSVPVADRKTAIVNKPARIGARGGLNLPNTPQIEMGGFVPILPGFGGFKPIPNPQLTSEMPITKPYILEKENAESMGHPISTPFSQVTTLESTSDRPENFEVKVVEADTSEQAAKIQEVTIKPKSTTSKLLTIPSGETESNFSLENLSVEVTTTEPEILEALQLTTLIFETSTSLQEPPTTANTAIMDRDESKKVVATSLSALLVPGGQQSEVRPAGRPTITKVPSPHVSGSAPLLSSLQMGEIQSVSQTREPKIGKDYAPSETTTKEDTSWYFANYNKTSLEPFVGGNKQSGSCGQEGLKTSFGLWVSFIGLFLVDFLYISYNSIYHNIL